MHMIERDFCVTIVAHVNVVRRIREIGRKIVESRVLGNGVADLVISAVSRIRRLRNMYTVCERRTNFDVCIFYYIFSSSLAGRCTKQNYYLLDYCYANSVSTNTRSTRTLRCTRTGCVRLGQTREKKIKKKKYTIGCFYTVLARFLYARRHDVRMIDETMHERIATKGVCARTRFGNLLRIIRKPKWFLKMKDAE
jgi:hypothetical protein